MAALVYRTSVMQTRALSTDYYAIAQIVSLVRRNQPKLIDSRFKHDHVSVTTKGVSGMY